MKQLEVFNKIGGIIKELNDQYKYIEANPENLNELELELFVANTHFLADHAEILAKINLRNKTDKVVEPKQNITAEKYFEPVVQQPKRELKPEAGPAETTPETDEPPAYIDHSSEPPAYIDLSSDTPADSYSYIREEPEIIRHELIIDEADDTGEENEDEATADEETHDDIVVEPPWASFKNEVNPFANKEADDKPKEEVVTINQRISEQLGSSNSIVEQAGTQLVTNLKQAITLNDKLLYIRDLFNGYSLAYSEAIEILNRFNTFEEANRYLDNNYVTKNKWESKPDTTAKFYALLKRRYNS